MEQHKIKVHTSINLQHHMDSLTQRNYNNYIIVNKYMQVKYLKFNTGT